MSKEKKIIGELRTGNPIKFEKEELEDLKKEIDTDKLINAGKLVDYHDDDDDALLTEEEEMYWFDQFHESYIELTTGSTDYLEKLRIMWKAIRLLYHHYETCSDEPMRDIKNRIMDNYRIDLFDEMDVFKTLYTAMNDVPRFTSDYRSSRYLAMLLREYAKGVSDAMKSEITSDSKLVYFGSNYATIYVTSVIMQYSAILVEVHPSVNELDIVIEQMNQVCDTSMLNTLVGIDNYLAELEDNDHCFASDDEDMIEYYRAFCSEMKHIIEQCPIFTAENHAALSQQRVSDKTDEYSTMRLTIDEYSDILTETGYPVEDVIIDIMKELTNVGSCYSSQLVGDDVCIMFTKDSPEIKNIMNYVDVGTFEDMVALLEKFYSMDFTDDDVYRAYEFSLIQLKLGTIIDILKTVVDENDTDTQVPESLNRDTTLYSYYTKLSKMLRDIADVLITTQDLTEFPTDVVLWKLKTFYYQYELANYNFDSIYEYIEMMDNYITESYDRLNNAYDISIYQISLAYINYVKLLLDFDDNYQDDEDDACEDGIGSDNDNSEYSVAEDIATYAGAIGHFTNVLTEVMTNKLSLVDPMGIRVSSCDRNYVNIMKGLLSIEEDMSVDKGLSVSAFRAVVMEYIPKTHLENLRTRVMRHDPSSSDYDESLNIVCEETLQQMINVIDKDILWFLDQVKDKYFDDDVVCALFKTNMQAYYNIIQLFKDSYDSIVH